jgi:squalene cyclase
MGRKLHGNLHSFHFLILNQSCVIHEYVEHEESQVINTAWALLALMSANYPDHTPIRRGIEFIIRKQQRSGDWEQEGISGVFNGNCMITYTAYRNVFPIWALGRYATKYAPGHPAR